MLTRSTRRTAAFTLAEVALALIVFLVMTLMFAAVFPVAVRAARMGNNYSQAAEFAQHKIDQVRAGGWGSLSGAALIGRGVVDAAQPAGFPVTNPAGFASGSVQYSFTTADNLTTYFPPGSTGTLTLEPDLSAPAGRVMNVIVRLQWTGGGATDGGTTVRAKMVNL